MFRLLLPLGLRPWRAAGGPPGHDDARAHHLCGLVLQAHRRHADAIAEYTEAIRLAPGLADAHFNMGRAYWELGRWSDCVNAWEETLRIQPAHPEVPVWLSRARGMIEQLPST